MMVIPSITELQHTATKAHYVLHVWAYMPPVNSVSSVASVSSASSERLCSSVGSEGRVSSVSSL